MGRLVIYDAMAMEFSEFRLAKDPDCPVCGTKPSVTELIDYAGFCGLPAEAEDEVAQLSALELSKRIERGGELLLLDVREPDEYARTRIEGSRLIPLGQLGERLSELADWREREFVVHCHHGGRSEKACKLLRAAGFARVTNLDGGIEAWSLTVDPSVVRY